MRSALVVVLAGTLLHCATSAPVKPEPNPGAEATLSENQVAALIPPKVQSAEGWARDVMDALGAQGLPASRENVCSVLAIISQESSFQENPAVPNLAPIVRTRITAYESKLGPLGKPAFHALMDGKAPGTDLSFEQRLARVHTERDVDRIFRDLLEFYQKAHPLTFGAAQLADRLFNSGRLEDLNPITTAGCMQVSVRFALEQPETRKLSISELRDSLYTRHGGVHFGTARLLRYRAAYDAALYRFADYNGGMYSSRNAAVQHQVADLTGIALTSDGDLQAYGKSGQPLAESSKSLRALLAFAAEYPPGLSEGQVREDVAKEKDAGFEGTRTYQLLKRVYRERTGKTPAYAELPNVVISSPKMSHDRSTAWYANAVQRRYDECQRK